MVWVLFSYQMAAQVQSDYRCYKKPGPCQVVLRKQDVYLKCLYSHYTHTDWNIVTLPVGTCLTALSRELAHSLLTFSHTCLFLSMSHMHLWQHTPSTDNTALGKKHQLKLVNRNFTSLNLFCIDMSHEWHFCLGYCCKYVVKTHTCSHAWLFTTCLFFFAVFQLSHFFYLSLTAFSFSFFLSHTLTFSLTPGLSDKGM